MVAGGSKRGWTTWTTAAVDKRVFAAIPIVMDMLDFNIVRLFSRLLDTSLKHQINIINISLESSQTF